MRSLTVEIVGVSKPRTSGSLVTKKGRKAYRGKRKHWYVYFYDDEGKFRKRRINPVEVPYYGSLIWRRKMYKCGHCGNKFRALRNACPMCGTAAERVTRSRIPMPKSGGTEI